MTTTADAATTAVAATTTDIDQYIRVLVDAAPPLSHDQRNKLAALLRPQPEQQAKS